MSEPPIAPVFDSAFRDALAQLFAWRRDVRRFRSEPMPGGTIESLVQVARLAPSVGYSQPSRFVTIEETERRARVIAEYERANREALGDFTGERAQRYAQLKLAGLREAPVHLAVFVDCDTSRGSGLGRRSMPETLAYSTVLAVHTLWLAARAQGIGVGWVSIFDPHAVARILDVPEAWQLIAYLCVGYPQEEHLDRELERAGWEVSDPAADTILRR